MGKPLPRTTVSRPGVYLAGVAFALNPSLATAADEFHTHLHDTIKQTLGEQFHYDRAVHEKATAEQTTEDPSVIQMERMVVLESKTVQQVGQYLAEKKRVEAAKAFNLKDGGRLMPFTLGPLPAELGIWVYEDPISDPVDGHRGGSGPTPKWDLIHVRF